MFAAAGFVHSRGEGTDQFARALPLLRPLVLQQHFMVAATYHAQAGRGGIDDNPAEGLALGDGFVGGACRQDDLALIPADGHPAQPDQHQEGGGDAGQRPERITEEVPVGHGVDSAPAAVGLFVQAEHQALGFDVEALVHALQRGRRTNQHLAGWGDEVKVVIHGPVHDAFEIVDLRQVHQRRHLHALVVGFVRV